MITIVVPTYNRSDFLIRLLEFYRLCDFKHQILVGDSSDPAQASIVEDYLKTVKNKVKVRYEKLPGLTEPQCTWELIKKAETPYLAWVADDDLLMPAGVHDAVSFLADNPEYSVAFGKSILINLGHAGPYGTIQGMGSYDLQPIEAETGAQRILEHLNHYSNSNFGVHRTEQFRKAYRGVPDLTDKGFTELMPNCIAAIQGKVKKLGSFYLMRQTHERRYRLPTLFDWVTGANWQASYQVYIRCLTQALVLQDGITPEQAQEIGKQAFWTYLYKGLASKYQNNYGRPAEVKLKTLKDSLKQIPGLIKIWRKIKKKNDPLAYDPEYVLMTQVIGGKK